jgi:hypothetical protein
LSLRITFTSISLVETRGQRRASHQLGSSRTQRAIRFGLTKGDLSVCDKGKRQEISEI